MIHLESAMAETNDLVGLIYDAATEPALWPLALQRIGSSVRAQAAWLSVFDHATGNVGILALGRGTDGHWVDLFHSTYAEFRPLGADLFRVDEGNAFSAFFSVDEQMLVDSKFYRGWCAPQGLTDVAMALITKQADRAIVLWLARGGNQARFDAADFGSAAFIAAHLRRSIKIGDWIDSRTLEAKAYANVVHHLTTAVVIVEPSGRVLKTNPAADALIEDGRLLTIRDRLIFVICPAGRRAVNDALRQAMTAPVIVPLARDEKQPLLAAVLPIKGRVAAFAIVLHSPCELLPSIGNILMKTFLFTPREVTVVMRLIAGRSLEEIASELGVGHATARTHLNGLFTKTRTSRQADLVQCVMRALPPIVLPAT